jgi:hypothetical protein
MAMEMTSKMKEEKNQSNRMYMWMCDGRDEATKKKLQEP